MKGNPSAVRCADNKGMIPLHVACQHHETPAVVEYLIGLNKVTLGITDGERNTVLHCACRGGNHAMIALLLDKYGSMSVSKRNAKEQLPIHLLLESNDDDVSGRDDIKYVESAYRLMTYEGTSRDHDDLHLSFSLAIIIPNTLVSIFAKYLYPTKQV